MQHAPYCTKNTCMRMVTPSSSSVIVRSHHPEKLAEHHGSAKRSGAAIRCHWHVENRLHYTRDVTFQEDRSRVRRNPGVFARLHSFGYNILRRKNTSTFNQDRYATALMGLDDLLKWCVS
jgi:hypothetical protein